MSYRGTAAYRHAEGIPALVSSAVEAAEMLGFEESCLPAQGRLLALLVAGVGDGTIGETGTGCGVGLAWMAQAAHPAARLTSIERDGRRAEAARDVFAGHDGGPAVQVLNGDWSALAAYGPFDMLVLDGGGHGKTGQDPLELSEWLRPGGVVVIDDFTPFDRWPPRHGSDVDLPRLRWLQHTHLLASEITLTPTTATIVGRYLGPDRWRDRRT